MESTIKGNLRFWKMFTRNCEDEFVPLKCHLINRTHTTSFPSSFKIENVFRKGLFLSTNLKCIICQDDYSSTVGMKDR